MQRQCDGVGNLPCVCPASVVGIVYHCHCPKHCDGCDACADHRARLAAEATERSLARLMVGRDLERVSGRPPERLGEATPDGALAIALAHAGEDAREATVTGWPGRLGLLA